MKPIRQVGPIAYPLMGVSLVNCDALGKAIHVISCYGIAPGGAAGRNNTRVTWFSAIGISQVARKSAMSDLT